ncbi:uncharacterized protein EV420DRAFT_1530760 [Desarmillaria tabescens]|uniref:Tail specific protease domain-containing protein n=1 Tax=Armillaria tabescens TaxID=1929756 RepID=A0AA39N8V6_ARMTA|nr:uncharacterized protein EV420DRAFT_1530760 [Desarmillaria tabescens]KAK0461182.1 hypothetical protein EV420DRAFT_1530760 [Desarmillaria tabescens]
MVWLAPLLLANLIAARPPKDACAAIAGKKWVTPIQARACISLAPVDPVLKANTIEVLNKTLAFHTSVNYQIQAPKPFQHDVHEDLHVDLDRISQQDHHPSEFDLHLDLFRTFKRVNDGHCVVLNYCYDCQFPSSNSRLSEAHSVQHSTYPTSRHPSVLLSDDTGAQHVHIAPEAFSVASAEFGDEIEYWQKRLPGTLKGKLQSLSGARVLLIDGQDPFIAVNANAQVTGSYQSLGTRQNSFFASYHRGRDGWEYVMGNFAQQTHPLVDAVELTIQRVNSTSIDTVTIPYRSRFGSNSKNFTDFESYRANNCFAGKHTNGYDVYADGLDGAGERPIAYFQQQPPVDPRDARRHPMNVIVDAIPPTDIKLPEELQPIPPALNESYSVAQFYLLDDKVTGVLALGSFAAQSFSTFQSSLLSGLNGLKSLGAKRLVVDVTNNGGGYICIAHWLHRIIIGPKESTEPQAGLDSKTRAGPLAQLIVKKILDGADPEELLSYSPQLGQECQPFSEEPPAEPLFKLSEVVIVSNGRRVYRLSVLNYICDALSRCASSCSLFSITMSKLDGVKTVVVGGKKDTPQEYCGTVGGQSTDFSTIDTEIKTTHLKNHTLAPPDLLTNTVQGITWRLGFGIDDPEEPEEWQGHPADLNLPLTEAIVNKPVAIWETVVREVFEGDA